MTDINQAQQKHLNTFIDDNKMNLMNVEGELSTSDVESLGGLESELKELFTEKEFCANDAELSEVNEQIEELKRRIEKLKRKVDTINKAINENEKKINESNARIVTLIDNINIGSREYKSFVDLAILAATGKAAKETGIGNEKNTDGIFKSIFNKELESILNNAPGVNVEDIKKWYEEYENIQNQLDEPFKEIADKSKEVRILQTQLRNINGSINFLVSARNCLEGTTISVDSAYSNNDIDANIPIFSGKKQKIATDILLGDYNSTSFKQPDRENLKSQYIDKYLTNEDGSRIQVKQGGDVYNYTDNPAIEALGKALDDGMFEDLQKAGMTNDEILTWIGDEWGFALKNKNKNRFKKENGEWQIPFGHSLRINDDGTTTTVQDKVEYNKDKISEDYRNDLGKAHEVFTKLKTIAETSSDSKLNADSSELDEEAVSRLANAMKPDKNGKNILDKMYDNGFTFKEAMYVIKQTFGENCGIQYNLDKQEGKRNYAIIEDSNNSNNLFKSFESKVSSLWGVTADEFKSAENFAVSEEFSDPIVFEQNNSTYTFLAKDWNDDKKYSGRSDLLGYQKGVEATYNEENGIQAFADFDIDGNGIIEGDELKNVFLMKNTQTESVNENNRAGKSDNTNTVGFSATFVSAEELGIKSIYYKNTEETEEKNKVIAGNNTKNINGSKLVSEFKIETEEGAFDTTDIKGQQLNVTDNYLKVFYDQLKSDENIECKKMFASFSEEEIEDFFKNYYKSEIEANEASLKSVDESIKGLINRINKFIKDYTNESGTNERYNLNIDYNAFIDWYSNGKESRYVKEASKIAHKVGFENRHADGNLLERNIAKAAVKDAIDNAVDQYGIKLGNIDIIDETTRKAVHKSGENWIKKNQNTYSDESIAYDEWLEKFELEEGE